MRRRRPCTPCAPGFSESPGVQAPGRRAPDRVNTPIILSYLIGWCTRRKFTGLWLGHRPPRAPPLAPGQYPLARPARNESAEPGKLLGVPPPAVANAPHALLARAKWPCVCASGGCSGGAGDAGPKSAAERRSSRADGGARGGGGVRREPTGCGRPCRPRSSSCSRAHSLACRCAAVMRGGGALAKPASREPFTPCAPLAPRAPRRAAAAPLASSVAARAAATARVGSLPLPPPQPSPHDSPLTLSPARPPGGRCRRVPAERGGPPLRAEGAPPLRPVAIAFCSSWWCCRHGEGGACVVSTPVVAAGDRSRRAPCFRASQLDSWTRSRVGRKVRSHHWQRSSVMPSGGSSSLSDGHCLATRRSAWAVAGRTAGGAEAAGVERLRS